MVKFAESEEKSFDPISAKTLSSIAAPVQQRTSPAPSESGPAPEPIIELRTSARERRKQAAGRRPGPKKLSPKPGRGERLTRAVKCLFTPSEEQELRALVGRLATAAGTSLTVSHLMRPYFDLLLHCEEELAQELGRAGISRPLNDKTALAYFERQLAEAVHTALRKAPILRADHLDSEE